MTTGVAGCPGSATCNTRSKLRGYPARNCGVGWGVPRTKLRYSHASLTVDEVLVVGSKGTAYSPPVVGDEDEERPDATHSVSACFDASVAGGVEWMPCRLECRHGCTEPGGCVRPPPERPVDRAPPDRWRRGGRLVKAVQVFPAPRTHAYAQDADLWKRLHRPSPHCRGGGRCFRARRVVLADVLAAPLN